MKLQINAKCSDLCYTTVTDSKGNTIREHDGYVPDFMPDDHYGDYVMLDIDPKTGQILNWDKSNFTKLKRWIKETD